LPEVENLLLAAQKQLLELPLMDKTLSNHKILPHNEQFNWEMGLFGYIGFFGLKPIFWQKKARFKTNITTSIYNKLH